MLTIRSKGPVNVRVYSQREATSITVPEGSIVEIYNYELPTTDVKTHHNRRRTKVGCSCSRARYAQAIASGKIPEPREARESQATSEARVTLTSLRPLSTPRKPSQNVSAQLDAELDGYYRADNSECDCYCESDSKCECSEFRQQARRSRFCSSAQESATSLPQKQASSYGSFGDYSGEQLPKLRRQSSHTDDELNSTSLDETSHASTE